jgi:MarC family integral membrane protein
MNLDTNLHQVAQAIVTVLAVINPVVCGSIFLTLTPRLSPEQRRRAATKVALSILIILVTAALVGLKILSIFNISLDAFRIVGGDDHRIYGIRYAEGRSHGRSSAAHGRRSRRTEFTCPANHVRRRSRDDHRRGDLGGRSHSRWLSGDRTCRSCDRRRGYARGLASCDWGRIASRPRHAGHGHPLHGAHPWGCSSC